MKKPEPNIGSIYGIKMPLTYTSKTPEIPHQAQILGMEIEVENCRHGADSYHAALDAHQWLVTNDSSLRGRAFEFISKPMNAISLINSVNYFYTQTGFTETNFTDRCSIHVHANVVDMTVDQLSSLALCYQTIEQVLFEFVGGHRDTNLYCIPWSQCLMNHKLINGLYTEGTDTLKRWQKYTALNLLPILKQGTVEFRHMHGTADIAKITTWLNIISHLLYKAKSSSFDEIFTDITTLNDSSQYNRYFDSVFNGFLPYNDKYRLALQDGVIQAKYSLVGFDPDKREVVVPPKKKAISKEEAILGLREGGLHNLGVAAGTQYNAVRWDTAARRIDGTELTGHTGTEYVIPPAPRPMNQRELLAREHQTRRMLAGNIAEIQAADAQYTAAIRELNEYEIERNT
jgi:hypothetical protein